MNERQPYELLIAAKLEALPAMPAMADAIWARISRELDNDLPPDDPEPPAPPTSPAGTPTGALRWPGMAIVLIAAAGLWLWYQRSTPNHATAPASNSTPAVQTDTTVASPNPLAPVSASPPPANAVGTTALPESRPADTAVYNNNGLVLPPDLPASQDAANNAASLNNQPEKTTSGNPSTVPVASPPNLQPAAKNADTTAGKKPRGVPGINRNDYRIAPPKKDS
ncbi:hypothetical protein [Phnomibacter ginsenosidimutans]|uniref:Uncharacterized protein n=1 Tax=Phnomibacter ginsenosidimutans TaxID=2676868 RepID=A0A6I6GK76_9BACT|nr:hypothetical protein [Phnomibacter ginsenosidimutans]QGW27312.1 hypothetical protein GLV81_03595 [Phnomibacter ginsenosidimutans]